MVRGEIGSSFVAFLLGITEVNPLRPHYHCKACRYLEFVPGVASGFDLPGKPCPHCGNKMMGDGHGIPFEAFAGLHGEKALDMGVETPHETTIPIKSILESLFPDDMIFQTGYTKVKNELRLRPGTYMIIPQQYINDVPITYDGERPDIAVTGQEYRELVDQYCKVGVLTSHNLRCLSRLASETGIPIESISMNDPQIYKALHEDGKCAFNEYGTTKRSPSEMEFINGLLDMYIPSRFSDLVAKEHLRHGAGAWSKNADMLPQGGEAMLRGFIPSAEDVFSLLVSKGMARERAYEVMETIAAGKGRHLPDDVFDEYDGSSPNSVKQAVLKVAEPGSGAQVDHGNEVVDVAETETSSDDGLDDIVGGLEFAAGKAML